MSTFAGTESCVTSGGENRQNEEWKFELQFDSIIVMVIKSTNLLAIQKYLIEIYLQQT